MHPSELKGLKEDGLKLVIGHLDKEFKRASTYDEMRMSPGGKFLIEELKERLNLARNLYMHIEPSDTHSQFMLTRVQAYEREAQEWLNRINLGIKRKEEISNDIEMIKKMVRNKKDKTKRTDQRFTVKTKEEIENG